LKPALDQKGLRQLLSLRIGVLEVSQLKPALDQKGLRLFNNSYH